MVDYPDNFAIYRMDIGMNTEFKMKLTPKDDNDVYSQELPILIDFKEIKHHYNNKISNNTNANNTNIQKDRRPKPVYLPCETCGKTSHSTEKCTLEQTQLRDRLPGIDDRKDKTNSCMHCQLWKVDETMCSIDYHTVVSHEVQPYNRSRQILDYDELFCKDVISNAKLKCGCCYCLF